VAGTSDRDISITLLSDDMVLGGMTYQLDPSLKAKPLVARLRRRSCQPRARSWTSWTFLSGISRQRNSSRAGFRQSRPSFGPRDADVDGDLGHVWLAADPVWWAARRATTRQTQPTAPRISARRGHERDFDLSFPALAVASLDDDCC
jgi:hypothetical protein